MDVSAWLKRLELGEYAAAFAANHVDAVNAAPAHRRRFAAPLAIAVACWRRSQSWTVIVGASGGGYTAIGEAVNLAARLTDLAPPGEIFVPRAVQLALADSAEFEARGHHKVKGFAEPIEIWRLAGLAQQKLSTLLTPFVGRGAELAQIAWPFAAGADRHARGRVASGRRRIPCLPAAGGGRQAIRTLGQHG